MIKLDKEQAILRARKTLKTLGYDTSKMTGQEVEEMFKRVGDKIVDVSKDLKKKAKGFIGGLLK